RHVDCHEFRARMASKPGRRPPGELLGGYLPDLLHLLQPIREPNPRAERYILDPLCRGCRIPQTFAQTICPSFDAAGVARSLPHLGSNIESIVTPIRSEVFTAS